MGTKGYTVAGIYRAATNVRKRVLKLTLDRGGCYLGQACSSAEIINTLYKAILKMGPSLGSMEALPFPGVPGPDNMDYPNGSLYHGEHASEYDRFFVSPAHYASVIYCSLVECGRISSSAIEKFNVDGWNMEMIGAEHSPGFECTAGSLGQTISIAAGTAHARKLRKDTGKVFVLLSDGEIEEGQAWEAFQAASFYQLDNLTVYVDVNFQQVEGWTQDVMNIEPLADRFVAFGWVAKTVDGHNVKAMIEAAETPHPTKPLAVLCHTNAARGIPLLTKRKPFLHFVRISLAEKKAFKAFLAKI